MAVRQLGAVKPKLSILCHHCESMEGLRSNAAK